MALIKKQVFRPSKDENLQQFLAKASSHKGLDQRWGQPSSKDKANTRARAEGNLIKPQKAVKSEPKSPWDDESDALDQGSDNSNTADDRTQKEFIIEGVQDAWVEKIFRRKPKTHAEQMERYKRSKAQREAIGRGAKKVGSKVGEYFPTVDDLKAVKRRVERTGVRNPLYDKGPKDSKKTAGGQPAPPTDKTTEGGKDRLHEGEINISHVASGAAHGADPYWGAEKKKAVQSAVWDAWFEKQESQLTRGKDESDEEWWKRLKEEEDMKDEARWDEQAERDQAGDEAEMDSWGDYEEDMRNQGPPDIDENQNESDAPRNVKKAIRDAWFEKGDVVPFESGDDKNIRETVEKTRRVTYNYIAANPEQFPDHHKNTDFSKPYDPETDSGLKPAIQQHQMKLKYKQNPEGTMKMQKAVYGYINKARSAANQAKVRASRKKAGDERSERRREGQHEVASRARADRFGIIPPDFAAKYPPRDILQSPAKQQDRKALPTGKFGQRDAARKKRNTPLGRRRQRYESDKETNALIAQNEADFKAATSNKPSEAEEYFRARI